MPGGLLDLPEGFTGFQRKHHSLLHITDHLILHHIIGAGNQVHHLRDGLLDLPCTDIGGLRQLAHLSGHHRKASAVFTGPGCFNACIQRQKIGLLGDG
ncbi:hypothetical protein D3C75_1161380 [compost metagenome]